MCGEERGGPLIPTGCPCPKQEPGGTGGTLSPWPCPSPNPARGGAKLLWVPPLGPTPRPVQGMGCGVLTQCSLRGPWAGSAPRPPPSRTSRVKVRKISPQPLPGSPLSPGWRWHREPHHPEPSPSAPQMIGSERSPPRPRCWAPIRTISNSNLLFLHPSQSLVPCCERKGAVISSRYLLHLKRRLLWAPVWHIPLLPIRGGLWLQEQGFNHISAGCRDAALAISTCTGSLFRDGAFPLTQQHPAPRSCRKQGVSSALQHENCDYAN